MQSTNILDGAVQDWGARYYLTIMCGQLSGFRGILLSLCRYRKRETFTRSEVLTSVTFISFRGWA